MFFDPGKHPRDWHGRWVDTVKGLRTGQSAQLPDGTTVTAYASKNKGRTTRRFRVQQAAGDMHEALRNLRAGVSTASVSKTSAEQAAMEALHRSARSANPASIGGAERFQDFHDFKRRKGLRVAA